MSRYPTGMNPAWFPHEVTVLVATSRDVYGQITATSSKDMKADFRPATIELIEAGSRVKRDGAKIKLAKKPGIEIDIGTVIQYGSTEYTVIGMGGIPDHRGEFHFWQLDCVKKASDQV